MEIPCPGAIDGKEFGAPRGQGKQSHYLAFIFSAQGHFQVWNAEKRGRRRQSEQMKAGGDYWAPNGGMTGEWLLFDTERTDSTLMKWVGIKSIHTTCFREFLAHREKERSDLKT